MSATTGLHSKPHLQMLELYGSDKHARLLFLALMGCSHRDKTSVCTPAKMFPHLVLLRWLFMDPALSFDT